MARASLLLLTATPHMGKDYPYYALWRLLEPEVLTTTEAFDQFPAEHRKQYFIRRTKEEMVKLTGEPLYPRRIADTLAYDLTQGDRASKGSTTKRPNICSTSTTRPSC